MTTRTATGTRWGAVLALVGFTGCYDGLSGSEGAASDSAGGAETDGDADGDGDGDGDGVDALCGESARARIAPLRRMTNVQYRNTVRDLFDGAVEPSEAFPTTLHTMPFETYPEANPVSQLGAESIMNAAEEVAAQATDNLASVLPCSPASGEAACADEFIASFGRRAFRRPLRTEELQLLQQLYNSARSEVSFDEAIGHVIAAMLQMPQFLYFVEEGEATDDADIVRLTGYEVASRLSYLLWDTMPDDALLDAAEAGDLEAFEDIESQARRLLDDPRSTPVLARFSKQWLEVGTLSVVDKDTDVFPEYDETLTAAMDEEFERFVARAYRSGEGSLQALLTSNETEVNAPLAALYGIDSSSTGPDDWQSVTLDPTQRGGVLTLPAVIAANSSAAGTNPIFRGKMMRTQMLCQEMPPPPDELDVPEFPPDASERDKSDILLGEATCSGCHQMMNPLGLSLEHYDAIGAWRDVDEFGNPIDGSGEILAGPPGLAGEFYGAPEFAAMLADSEAMGECMTVQWMRYTYGRKETADDECVVEALSERFAESGYDLQELLVAFTQTEGFRLRRISGDQ